VTAAGTNSGTSSAPGSRQNALQPLVGMDRTAGPVRSEQRAAEPQLIIATKKWQCQHGFGSPACGEK
jgi:hypothetical protein